MAQPALCDKGAEQGKEARCVPPIGAEYGCDHRSEVVLQVQGAIPNRHADQQVSPAEGKGVRVQVIP